MLERKKLTRFAWLSIATAVLTITLKVGAYLLTGSVGLLSDALESGVNLVTAVLSLIVLTIAAQPPDAEHSYGHAKAEYFASGAEGMLILFAAISIGVTAVQRLFNPQPLEQLGIGLLVSVVAAACNGVVAQILLRAGQEHESPTLVGEAKHLMTDVWTSLGVLVGVGAVAFTGWQWLDPVIALLVALQIVYAGVKLLREAINGLMDIALPPEEMAIVTDILKRYHDEYEITYHALRSRQSGAQRFVSVHLQVPGEWSVQHGHEVIEDFERDVREALPRTSVFTHLEPIEDPVSWEDISLNRPVDA